MECGILGVVLQCGEDVAQFSTAIKGDLTVDGEHIDNLSFSLDVRSVRKSAAESLRVLAQVLDSDIDLNKLGKEIDL